LEFESTSELFSSLGVRSPRLIAMTSMMPSTTKITPRTTIRSFGVSFIGPLPGRGGGGSTAGGGALAETHQGPLLDPSGGPRQLAAGPGERRTGCRKTLGAD